MTDTVSAPAPAPAARPASPRTAGRTDPVREIRNPATGAVLRTVPEHGAADVDRAVAAAHTAFGLDVAEVAVVYAGTGR